MNNIIGFFLPKETKFFELLEKQSETVLEASDEFHSFMKNYNSMNEKKRAASLASITKLENKGDRQTYEIIGLLDKSLITPFDREDIHSIAVALDDVLDIIDGTARKFQLYKIKKVPKRLMKQADLVKEMVKKINSTMKHLYNLNEAKKHCEELYGIENKGDALYEESISELFDGLEKNKSMVCDVIKLKDIYEGLEDAFDKGKDLADIIQEIVVKHG
jgi:hypothetical protein